MAGKFVTKRGKKAGLVPDILRTQEVMSGEQEASWQSLVVASLLVRVFCQTLELQLP